MIDLVTANAFSNTMSILLGAGDGTFAPKLDFVARAGSVELHDLDGDSNLDLVGVSGTGTLDVLLRSCR